jgi:Methyltransferase domain
MNALPSTRERLPFVLPDFTRHSWVGEEAQVVWEPRIERIQHAWFDMEWNSVVAGIRTCGLVWLSPEMVPVVVPQWEACHLSATRLQQSEGGVLGSGGTGAPQSASGLICAVVGSIDAIAELHKAWEASDHETIGTLFGYPSCCRAFFRDVWVNHLCIDTTWAMAINTTLPGADGSVRIELPGDVPPFANILWRWLGIRAVPHLPCRFNCPVTIAFGKRMLEVGEKVGYEEEVGWIREMLSWPIEWSGLHGIAEVKTPILKISTRTDATAIKEVVRWTGAKYPREGAVGLRFPYQAPSRPLLTRSRSFKRGLDHATQASAESMRPTWYYTDNGFSSEEAMRQLHQPIVDLARGALEGIDRNVLDLGCGNGLLLAKICDGRSGLTPYGVDSNRSALEHAHTVMPQFAANFVQGDLFDVELWGNVSHHYALTLLMFGRLLEVPKPQALRLLNRLRTTSERVLVYVYPDWGDQSLEVMVRRFGLELETSSSDTTGFISFPMSFMADR